MDLNTNRKRRRKKKRAGRVKSGICKALATVGEGREEGQRGGWEGRGGDGEKERSEYRICLMWDKRCKSLKAVLGKKKLWNIKHL